jgi:hypothetical protein
MYQICNKKSVPDHTNSQYYLVVVQYVESINTNKLSSELPGLRPPGSGRLEPKYFSDMRLAPEEVLEKLTGYGHNGVSPFGRLVCWINRFLSLFAKAYWMSGPNSFIWVVGTRILIWVWLFRSLLMPLMRLFWILMSHEL